MSPNSRKKERQKTKTELQIKYELKITVEEKEAGPLSQMDNLEVMKRVEAVEAQLTEEDREGRKARWA